MGMYLDGMMGLIVGDALGVPYETAWRNDLKKEPVVGMDGYKKHNLPPGSWSDDSSMALCTLDSLQDGYDPIDIINKFVIWAEEGEYTPYGKCFDIGGITDNALWHYQKTNDIRTCGGDDEYTNGNGSLMRILPMCLYCKDMEADKAIQMIHEVSALTHAHLRSKIACGLYYFVVKSVLDNSGSLTERMQKGFNEGFAYYEKDIMNRVELANYDRLRDLAEFKDADEDTIESSGYVVAAFEAAVWCLINTDTYADCVLKAVNLGDDTDTVAAIAGGIAGLYYGYNAIPKDWLNEIARRRWIEDLCGVMDGR